jgi:pimeloyl-ACP methyl ester carboxylesterase
MSTHNGLRTNGSFFVLAMMVAYPCEQLLSSQLCEEAHNCGAIIARDERSVKGVTIERVEIYPQKMANSSEKIMRRGVLVRREGAQANVVMAHGFMCTKEDIAILRSLFPLCNTLIFDMRAHGEDVEGQFCTFGRDEAFDVIAAAQFLRNHPDGQGLPLILYGFSMGAVATIEAMAQHPELADAVILDCPFDASENIIKRGLDHMKISLFGYEITIPGRTLLEKYAFHPYVQSFVKVVLKAVARLDSKSINTFMYPVYPAESVKKLRVPALFIHCKNDDLVPIAAVKAVYNNAGSAYKKLWITNGRRHYDSFFSNPELYAERIDKFTQKVIAGDFKGVTKNKIIEDTVANSMSVHIQVGTVKIKGR